MGVGRSSARRALRRLDAEVTELERRITHVVRRHGTSLTAICGVGALVAARIVGEVGDVRRFPTRNHFASSGIFPTSSTLTFKEILRMVSLRLDT